ncbi:hypothetical protein [Oenococcus sicerae]|uniref:Uncharacterized protein n=1 Tax=Oenococcus sicerae TaxID=2203724 RepID=A0AAJ1VMF0_9LACO|nr:hypothetical protein [Oenococcus sicerae]MDN6899586.1 hypothetical protein [Oenococcus sicerae]
MTKNDEIIEKVENWVDNFESNPLDDQNVSLDEFKSYLLTYLRSNGRLGQRNEDHDAYHMINDVHENINKHLLTIARIYSFAMDSWLHDEENDSADDDLETLINILD